MTNVGTEERAAVKKIATIHREKKENLVQRLRPTSSFSVLVTIPVSPGRDDIVKRMFHRGTPNCRLPRASRSFCRVQTWCKHDGEDMITKRKMRKTVLYSNAHPIVRPGDKGGNYY